VLLPLTLVDKATHGTGDATATSVGPPWESAACALVIAFVIACLFPSHRTIPEIATLAPHRTPVRLREQARSERPSSHAPETVQRSHLHAEGGLGAPFVWAALGTLSVFLFCIPSCSSCTRDVLIRRRIPGAMGHRRCVAPRPARPPGLLSRAGCCEGGSAVLVCWCRCGPSHLLLNAAPSGARLIESKRRFGPMQDDARRT
jgi:hypothetical protein